MLKAPVPGSVKTRLAETLGAEQACAIYRMMVERVVAEVPEHWRCEVHGAPPDQLHFLSTWLGTRATYRPQPDGDLGTRLIHASAMAFADGAESVVLLGGDCPWQDRAFFRANVDAQLTHDLGVGPARDGGYTLLAAKKLHQALFEDIPWSTARVLNQTLLRALSLGLRVALLEVLEDVDDAVSWERARAGLFPDFRHDPQSVPQPNR